MSTQIPDPMESAVQDAESASHYFGKMEVDAQFVILRKGERKRPWTEGEDTDGRTTEVSLRLNPLDITGLTRMVERQVISSSSEWTRIVWPSLRDLGCKSLRDIHGQWAHVEMVPSGRKWTNKTTGEEITGTTFRFVGLYTLESDCVKAWEELMGGDSDEAHSATAAQPETNDAEKAVAAQFLPALVKGANGDLQALATILASMHPVSKYFTVDSPEVQQLLKAA